MKTKQNKNEGPQTGMVALAAAAERALVRPNKSFRHVDLAVTAPRADPEAAREALALALVLDRSGSMQGAKLQTAKNAALAVLDRLGDRDIASVTVFDEQIDMVLPAGAMTAARKAEARQSLSRIEARGTTALHEGWLTGCHSIAQNTPRLARCLLLTDGLANVGLTDAEQIAAQAADIHAKSGISTSTFGIGADYDEGLLAPMAVAGNGQFHHLRDEADLSATFEGELGELFDVTARSVRIEVEAGGASGGATGGTVEPELVSLYWARPANNAGPLEIELGDLIADETRHVVIRLGFSGQQPGAFYSVRARLSWLAGAERVWGDWRELVFECADHAACDAERADPAVMHWVGLHHAEKAKREALDLYKKGDHSGAIARLDGVIRRLATYAKGDPDLERALAELKDAREVQREDRVSAMYLREEVYQATMQLRGQRDHRAKGL